MRKIRPWASLNPLERQIRSTLPTGMYDEVRLTIEYVCGFEKFDSYETWASGFRVKGHGITLEREDLNDAINAWCAAYKAQEEAAKLLRKVQATSPDEAGKV